MDHGLASGVETSTSHRVTESSGDSTRLGHLGVRTRVIRESRSHESGRESEYGSANCESSYDDSQIFSYDATIVAPAAPTIVGQPLDCGFGLWLCAGRAAAVSMTAARTRQRQDHGNGPNDRDLNESYSGMTRDPSSEYSRSETPTRDPLLTRLALIRESDGSS
ncbi:hypothetical protein BDZ89DRAFT_1256575 [Hymenopellis radicata]|nr:hypothetical protein BDZ89DRAFT_1256575 [Hymenopellis radicata]